MEKAPDIHTINPAEHLALGILFHPPAAVLNSHPQVSAGKTAPKKSIYPLQFYLPLSKKPQTTLFLSSPARKASAFFAISLMHLALASLEPQAM